jgi:hypothetical protein
MIKRARKFRAHEKMIEISLNEFTIADDIEVVPENDRSDIVDQAGFIRAMDQ